MQANSNLENNFRYLFFFVFLFFIFGGYLRFEAFESIRITEWVTRDFDRAFHLFDGDYFPLAGPERNAGGRLLGPFLYVFLTIPLFFDYSYDSIFAFNLILNLFSITFFLWFTRKYLGNITSAFSTILLCINLVHLDSVGFPINPTFMFPLIFVFFFLLFKVFFEENTKYLPAIFLVISLGIQIHFSMATYYLIPLLVLIIFKIKLNRKDIFLSLFLSALCFVPYLIYKQQLYETTIKITEVFFRQEFDWSRIFEIVSLQNLFFWINQGTSLFTYHGFPEYVPRVNYFFSLISFWGLIVFLALKLRKNGLESCKKEIVLLISFYFPAIIYEITNPPTLWHYWHYFIFIVPVILLKARFLFLVFINFSTKFSQNVFYFLIIAALWQIAYVEFSFFRKSNDLWSQNIRTGDIYNPQKLKWLFPELTKKLKLSPEEFFTNVYLEGELIQPIKLLNPSSSNQRDLLDLNASNKPCFYIVPRVENGNSSIGVSEKVYSKLKYLSADKAIRLRPKNVLFLTLNIFGIDRNLIAFSYFKKYDQPCYTNLFNPFVVSDKTRDYLKESFGINKGIGSKSIVKEILKNEDFDSSSNLINWEKTILFFHPELNVPIKILVSINKQTGKYRLNSDIFYYSWGKKLKNLIQIKQIDFQIVSDDFPEESKNILIPIVEPDSWIANIPHNLTLENFHWYRNVDLPANLNLKKGKFFLKIFGKTFFPNNGKSCCLEFEFDINETQNN
jgi:hypothetical protein